MTRGCTPSTGSTWQHDYPTDVLSFILERDEAAKSLDGEIIASADYAAREAIRTTAGPQTTNYCCNVIHGCLHLVGHDDQTPDGLAAMRAAESEHLARFGLTHRFDKN
jgi:probable rRNA maturation factor